MSAELDGLDALSVDSFSLLLWLSDLQEAVREKMGSRFELEQLAPKASPL